MTTVDVTRSLYPPLDDIADCIKACESLRELLGYLREFERKVRFYDEQYNIQLEVEYELDSRRLNIAELPTFGGGDPSNTTGVWSWDEDSLLVGEGSFEDWRIIDRDDQ